MFPVIMPFGTDSWCFGANYKATYSTDSTPAVHKQLALLTNV
jgi:hypothetical protein